MSLEEVIRIIKEQSDIEESVKSFLFREEIPAFKSKTEYKDFLEMIRIDFLSAEEILIAGSGNWGYSFNPDKKGKAFDLESDIDVVIVSSEDFLRYWEEIRKFHRTNYYSMQSFEQLRIKRTGENIYSWFVTPKWLPRRHRDNIRLLELSNKYSNKSISYREVNLMFFKNKTELVDYYKRSFVKIYNS